MLFYFPYKHQKNRVYKCKINDYTEIGILRNWVIAQNPDNNSSSHWWYSELPADISLLYSRPTFLSCPDFRALSTKCLIES